MDTTERRRQLLEAVQNLELLAARTKRPTNRVTFLASADFLREEIRQLPVEATEEKHQ